MNHRITDFPDDVRSRNKTIVEDQFCSVRRPHAGFVVDLLTDRIALHALLDEEGRDLGATLRVGAGSSVQPTDICRCALFVDGTVRDPHLLAIDQPIAVIILSRCRLHSENICAVARLGHRHAADPFTAADLWENS